MAPPIAPVPGARPLPPDGPSPAANGPAGAVTARAQALETELDSIGENRAGFLRRLREQERVLYLSERAAARMRLHLTDGVLPRHVLRVAVAAGEIAPGKAHENLATADILALALDR